MQLYFETTNISTEPPFKKLLLQFKPSTVHRLPSTKKNHSL